MTRLDTATLVVGMSNADVLRRDELLAASRRLDASLAFLQQGDPAVGAELTRLADAGARTIQIVGIGVDPLAPGHSWLRRIVAYWWRERTSSTPDVLVATRLARSCQELATVLEQTRPVTGPEAGLTSTAWERVPPYRHQVLVCRGPRCTAKAAAESWRVLVLVLVLAMMEHGLGDDVALVVQTGCQFPCNQAPVISIQPDDVWYGHVDPPTAARIVTDHLLGGTPLPDHRAPRR